MGRRWLTLLPLFVALQANGGFSATTARSGDVSRYDQRQIYQAAIADIKAGRWAAMEEKKKALASYPLYPYLEYTAFIYSIQRQNSARIMPFVEAHRHSPISRRLLENWLFVLGARGRWDEFLAHYDGGLLGRRNACFHAHALYRTGRKEAATAAAKNLWLVDYSQPDECDPVFRLFRSQGGLVRNTAWQRLLMTQEAREYSLAGYLVRYLDSEDVSLADRLRQLRQNPGLIRRTGLFATDNEQTRDVISYGIRRLARQDAAAAFEALGSYRVSHGFNATELASLYEYVGVRIAQNGDPSGLLNRIPVDHNLVTGLVEARIRLALQQQHWSDALVLINQLPDTEANTPRWRYWKARILVDSSNGDDQASARDIYRELAKQRNFYGFVSADALGSRYEFQHYPIEIPGEEVLAIESRPGIQRALELFTIGERHDGRAEWQYATRDMSDYDLQVAARVAQKWGWYRQAIKSMIDAEAWNDLDMRFPLAYQHEFVTVSRRFDIPLNWSLAIARQESAFMPDARSTAGARGIMQLMPTTAKLAATHHNLSFNGNGDLNNPDRNIEIGAAYLGEMFRRFDRNRILATAAYNAGPSRVDRWRNPDLPLDVWIETIPFRETREYVQNVLMFAAIYARRLEQDQPLIENHEFSEFLDTRRLIADDEPKVTRQPDNS